MCARVITHTEKLRNNSHRVEIYIKHKDRVDYVYLLKQEIPSPDFGLKVEPELEPLGPEPAHNPKHKHRTWRDTISKDRERELEGDAIFQKASALYNHLSSGKTEFSIISGKPDSGWWS